MTSHRQIFRSSAIIGSATTVNIVIGIVKVKALAVLLGPTGIGLMGLYQNVMGLAATLAGCGLGISGVRQLAATVGEQATLAIVRRALWRANLILGLAGMAILWVLREPVAQWVFGSDAYVTDVGWLGLGVFLTLVAGSQTALLQGLRRIGDLARISVISAFVSAVVGIWLVYWLGQPGILWFVLAAPAFTVPVAAWYATRLPRPQVSSDWLSVYQQWLVMLHFGIPLMAAGLLILTTQLVARSIILRELGLDASGYFQAAWAISMTYIGFVLSAMATDYFPRLTATINDRPQARKLVNEQSEMALLLAGPVLLAMITLAPWIIQLLYSDSFSPASDVLRWQVMGDILKVASWPMGFILLAQGRGGIFICTELTWCAAYLIGIIIGVQSFGLIIAGVAFWGAYLIYYIVMLLVASRLIEYRPARCNIVITFVFLLTGGVIVLISRQSAGASYLVGLVATLAATAYSLKRLDELLDIRGWAARRFGDSWK